MKISVKILFGEERPFEVSSEMSVFELKAMVTEKCNIPLAKQKLLLNGRALVDNKKLSEYDIQEGTKLNVFVCQANQTKATEKPPVQSLQDLLYEKLTVYWSDEDAKKITDEFLRASHEKLYAMSLDDVERLATVMMEEDEVAAEAEAAVEAEAAAVSDDNALAQDTTTMETSALVKENANTTGWGDTLDDMVD